VWVHSAVSKAFSLLPVQSLGRPVVHFEATALHAFFGWVSSEADQLGDADGPFEENRYDGVNDECADTARRFRALLDVGPRLQEALADATKVYTAHCAEHGLAEDLEPFGPYGLPYATKAVEDPVGDENVDLKIEIDTAFEAVVAHKARKSQLFLALVDTKPSVCGGAPSDSLRPLAAESRVPPGSPEAGSKMCDASDCGEHGVCERLVCLCQWGWAGRRCEAPLFPACTLAPAPAPVDGGYGQPSPQLAVSCAMLRKLSPMACACAAQCLDAGHKIFDPASHGCSVPWKPWPGKATYGGDGTRAGFHAALPCLDFPPTVPSSSGLPVHPDARLTRLGSYLSTRDRRFNGSAPLAAAQPLGVFGAGERGRGAVRAGAVWVDSASCALGCSGRGRCMRTPSRERGTPRRRREGASHTCVCVDGSFGSDCETVCSNDCFNGCSGHGACVHGWCHCQRGWYGVDCSDSMGLRYRRASLPDDRTQFGEGPRDAQLALLPPALRAHAAQLRQAVFVYSLPPEVNRAGEAWMWRNWGDDAGQGCDPVHNRRIYSAQSTSTRTCCTMTLQGQLIRMRRASSTSHCFSASGCAALSVQPRRGESGPAPSARWR